MTRAGPRLGAERVPDVYVPDVAGWRRERLDDAPDDHRFTVCPDWVCEVYSPSSAGRDLLIKGQLYHRAGVGWMWVASGCARVAPG